jgi:hypothetical protein
MTDETVEPCDGRHPLIWPDGRQTYLYDLASHPGCPHQPWAAPEDEDALRGYADAKHTLAGSLRQMMGMLDDSSPMEAALGKVASVAVAQLDAPSPIRAILWPNFGAPAELQAPCYRTASGLAVHVRSGCRC